MSEETGDSELELARRLQADLDRLSPAELRQVCDDLLKVANPAQATPRAGRLLPFIFIALASIVCLVLSLVLAMSK